MCSKGRPFCSRTGGKLVSPYTRSDAYKAAQEAARRNTKQKAVQALEPAEIRILQRFYDQLCALVEAQRMSDPLCLMVVSKVGRAGCGRAKGPEASGALMREGGQQGTGRRHGNWLLARQCLGSSWSQLGVSEASGALEVMGITLAALGDQWQAAAPRSGVDAADCS